MSEHRWRNAILAGIAFGAVISVGLGGWPSSQRIDWQQIHADYLNNRAQRPAAVRKPRDIETEIGAYSAAITYFVEHSYDPPPVASYSPEKVTYLPATDEYSVSVVYQGHAFGGGPAAVERIYTVKCDKGLCFVTKSPTTKEGH